MNPTATRLTWSSAATASGPCGSDEALKALLDALGVGRRLAASGRPPQLLETPARRRGPAGPAIPRDRSAQPAVARGKPLRAARVLREARHELSRRVSEEHRALSRVLRHGGDRPLRHPAAAGQPADPQELRRPEMDRLRGRAGRVPGRVRLRRTAGAQGREAGRAAAGGRLPARPGGPADQRLPGRHAALSRFCRSAWPSAGS